MSLDNLKKAIKEKKLIMGSERTIKTLKKGEAKEIFISKNCPELLRKQVKNYAEISNIAINELKESNEEIGIICKKPFAINLCCY
jgi:large subunit ribosomal protein L30e